MSSSGYPPGCPGTLFSADGTVPLCDRCGFGSWQGAHSVYPKILVGPCCYQSNDESAQSREEAIDGYINCSLTGGMNGRPPLTRKGTSGSKPEFPVGSTKPLLT